MGVLSWVLLVGMAAATADPVRIAVRSFNIRTGWAPDLWNAWPFRATACLQAIGDPPDGDLSPDIVGLQEVLSFQLSRIRDAFPYYVSVGHGRGDGGTRGEYGPILFDARRWSLVDSGMFWLSDTPTVPGSKPAGASGCPRILTWARLRHRAAGVDVLALNTHLDHVSSRARLDGVHRILTFLRESNVDALPVILTGDFNNDVEDAPEITAVKQAGFVDSYRVVHPDDDDDDAGTFHAFTGRAASAKIDFVFATRGLAVVDAGIDRQKRCGRYPSDHFPISATLELDPRRVSPPPPTAT
ncbi:Endonuclease/exonuclease/phosphatase domain-containing protein [Plasmodiophora brassicae]|uniref:Endonuclease/exonuclease/phosphatase domain-containing protein n=1 Tax=Plasmodiophora brassicae TaxID=37360 RepID=A0A0G4IUY9_PLABS|nr:hypothetical protein PBRA_007078 [Plasmodiophora brassicae]SPQ95737.1 unnamed protein product [Plasmodiophora brassicae]